MNINDYFQGKFKGDTKWIQAVKDFFFEQDLWMRSMIKKMSSRDPYWRHMGYILSQYDGLVAGYGEAATSDMVNLHKTFFLIGSVKFE